MKPAVLRTFGTSRVSSFFPRNSPIGQHAPTWPQIRPNPAEPNGPKPSSHYHIAYAAASIAMGLSGDFARFIRRHSGKNDHPGQRIGLHL